MRLFLLLACLATPVFAADVAIPVGTKTVTFDLPDGFIQSFEEASDKAFIRGYLPEGESGADWQQMLTVTVTRNLAGIPTLSTVDFVNFGLSALKSQCLGSFGQEVVSPDYTISGQPALAIFASCTSQSGKPDGKSQSLVFVAFRGSTDFYALQWLERGSALTEVANYNASHWQARVDQIVTSARICDLKEGDTAPAPCPKP